MQTQVSSHPRGETTPRDARDGRTIFVTAPGGVLFTIDPAYADRCAARLARCIPDYARAHVAAGDYWVVAAKHAATARAILLLTTGTLLRLRAPSYPAAVGRLARRGRAETTLHDRGAA